jgi:hypothetical protein
MTQLANITPYTQLAIHGHYLPHKWAGVAQSVQRLATGWTVRGSNLGGGEIFRTCPDWPWGTPSHLYNGYRVFPGVKSGRGVTLTPRPLLVPWSWKSIAKPLLPLWAVQPVQSLSACTRVTFTFYLLHSHATYDQMMLMSSWSVSSAKSIFNYLLELIGYFTYHQV